MLNHTEKNHPSHILVLSDFRLLGLFFFFLNMSEPFDNNLTNIHSIAGGAFKIQMLKSISPLISTSFLLQQSSDIKQPGW